MSGSPAPVAANRRAGRDYEIVVTFEAGLVLTGTEVKSLRGNRANIAESYCRPEGNDFLLVNADIPPYGPSARFNHEPRRPRRMLLNRREINRLAGAVRRDGLTVVPLRLYFNRRGLAKLLVGLARGKKRHDKREAEKKRDWNRQKARLLRNRG